MSSKKVITYFISLSFLSLVFSCGQEIVKNYKVSTPYTVHTEKNNSSEYPIGGWISLVSPDGINMIPVVWSGYQHYTEKTDNPNLPKDCIWSQISGMNPLPTKIDSVFYAPLLQNYYVIYRTNNQLYTAVISTKIPDGKKKALFTAHVVPFKKILGSFSSKLSLADPQLDMEGPTFHYTQKDLHSVIYIPELIGPYPPYSYGYVEEITKTGIKSMTEKPLSDIFGANSYLTQFYNSIKKNNITVFSAFSIFTKEHMHTYTIYQAKNHNIQELITDEHFNKVYQGSIDPDDILSLVNKGLLATYGDLPPYDPYLGIENDVSVLCSKGTYQTLLTDMEYPNYYIMNVTGYPIKLKTSKKGTTAKIYTLNPFGGFIMSRGDSLGACIVYDNDAYQMASRILVEGYN